MSKKTKNQNPIEECKSCRWIGVDGCNNPESDEVCGGWEAKPAQDAPEEATGPDAPGEPTPKHTCELIDNVRIRARVKDYKVGKDIVLQLTMANTRENAVLLAEHIETECLVEIAPIWENLLKSTTPAENPAQMTIDDLPGGEGPKD